MNDGKKTKPQEAMTQDASDASTRGLDMAMPEKAIGWLSSLSRLIVRLNSVHVGAEARGVLLSALREITGATVAWVCDYDPGAMELKVTQIDAHPALLEKVLPLIAPESEPIRISVGEGDLERIMRETVSFRRSLSEVSFGHISPEISDTVQELLAIDHFIGLANAFDGRLYGTTVLGMDPGQADLPHALMVALAQITATFLKRWQTEILLKRSEVRYEETVAMISDIIWRYEVDGKGDFIDSYVSPVADRLLGLPAFGLRPTAGHCPQGP